MISQCSIWTQTYWNITLMSCKPFYQWKCLIDSHILGISESRLKTDVSTTTNIQLSGVNIKHMPVKTENSGALF